MKAFLKGKLSRRWSFDGWALKVKGVSKPMHWTACTTRKEARELKAELQAEGDLFFNVEVVKIMVEVTEVSK